MDKKTAEIIGLQALAWLMADDDLRGTFMGSTGADQDDVRQGANSPEFLGAVLDFIAMDDAWVIGFAQAHGLQNTDVVTARMSLPGGDLPNWT